MAQAIVRVRGVGIEFEHNTVLLTCFIEPIDIPQSIAILQVCTGSARQIGYDPGIALQDRRRAVRLSNPKRRQRNDKDRDPLQSVQGPAWKEIV